MTDQRKDEIFEKWHFETKYDRISFKEGMKIAFIAGMNADKTPPAPDDVKWAIETVEKFGVPAIENNSAFIAAIKIIRAALQTTRKPSVSELKLCALSKAISTIERAFWYADKGGAFSGYGQKKIKEAIETLRVMDEGYSDKPPVPADTIAMPMEVLQGVRDAMDALLGAIEHNHLKGDIRKDILGVVACGAIKYEVPWKQLTDLMTSIASLDAVLSEGE